MDLREFSKFGGGAFQYVPPRCYELAGQTFELLMDDGYDLVLNFTGKTTLEWNYVNKEPSAPQKEEGYECLKGDDTTYLVTFNVAGKEFAKRENFTFVIDLEQMLVTHLIAKVGTNPRWPYLITTEFVFGCIKQEGVEFKTYPRHGFTDDMRGNIVQWQYSPTMSTVHAYYAANWYRITYPIDDTKPREEQSTNTGFSEMMKKLPSSDEPCHYVKIKEGIYLVSCTEQNMEKLIGESAGFRSDTLCFLDNYNNCYDVGRGFGTMTSPGREDSNILVMIGAYGKIIDPESHEGYKKVLSDPNPYLP